MRLFGGNKVKEPPAPPPAAPPPIARVCLVHLPRGKGQAIVEGVWFEDTLWSEPDMIDCIEMEDHRALGEAAHGRWEACDRRRYEGPPVKATDEPAYRASGARSVSQFQRDWVWYRLTGANPSNIYIEIKSMPRADHIELHSTLPAGKPWELGQRLVKMHRSYLAWERAA